MRAFFFFAALIGLTLAEQLISRNYPHLIVPVDRNQPDTPLGTQKYFKIEPNTWTLMSFDVPINPATKCRFGFTLAMDGSPWAAWNVTDYYPYVINISSVPDDSFNQWSTTWNHYPEPVEFVGELSISKNGNSTWWWQNINCAKNRVAQFLMKPVNEYRQAGVTWYELDKPRHGITYDMYVD